MNPDDIRVIERSRTKLGMVELDLKLPRDHLGFAVALQEAPGLYRVTVVRPGMVTPEAPNVRRLRVREAFRDVELAEAVATGFAWA